ncbi:MAG: hypothetical protein A2V65_00055 [Deltaproteobacteria bacterium RBG_13_49_15]|nr:MAG: hypothetical protein A2V65_00055 [Deltaproteobacteria bacterium RBG_13_49_15]
MDIFNVITPGPYLTVQDRGRFGYQKMGIPISGALDSHAFHLANALVGNPPDSAALEITILGPRLEILSETDIALTGAEMKMALNGNPAKCWESMRVRPGDILDIGQAKSGCRGYLAVGGGIDVPEIMGSRSTYAGGKLGGFQGRPLKKGDVIQNGRKNLLTRPRRLAYSDIPKYLTEVHIRAIPGPQDDFFDTGIRILFHSSFLVTAKADRMGYRLQGPLVSLKEGMPKSIISEPAVPGSIQIPADLQPIILLLEQTVGGYAKIATVISSDLSKIAQATPGDAIRFEPVSLEAAHMLHREEFHRLQTIISLLSSR